VLTWDPGHTHALTGSDGTGDWSTTATKVNLTNWVNSSGVDVLWDGVSSASIGDGGTAGSIELKVAVVVNNIIFNQTSGSTGYLVSGSQTVTFLGGTNEVDNTAGPTTYHDLVLAGTVGFTKTGAGTLVFSGLGTPTFTGPLHIVAGELQLLSYTWTLSSSDLIVDSGALFDMNKNNATVGALTGAGTVNNSYASSETFTIGGDNDSGEFDGVIECTGEPNGLALVKTGTGTEILGGANTYGGGTTVSNGTLLVNGSVVTNVTVESGAGFGGTGTVGGKVTYLSGALAVFTNGTTPLAISGALVLNGNTVDLNLPAWLGEPTLWRLTGARSPGRLTPRRSFSAARFQA
jgi:autotransporter-associated beta strand protein